MITRDTLTKIFLNLWGKSIDDTNVKLFSRKWWQCNRINKQGAFRLTDNGLAFLTNELKIKAYEIPFSEPIEMSPQTLIFLEKYLDCPYHITHYCIIVFSAKRSFELCLFSDDIRKYGLIKAMKERETDN